MRKTFRFNSSKFSKNFLSKFFFVFIALASFSSWAEFSENLYDVCDEVAESLEEGDLVFVESSNKIFKKVATTQNHWASHVGIAFKNKNGDWTVNEATIPVSKESPLCEYVNKGFKTRLAVRRYNSALSNRDVRDLKHSAFQKLGIKYHLGFKLFSSKQFCSKFVYQIYKETLGIKVGFEQSFRELIAQSKDPAIVKFWRVWFLGFIPWDRITVSPASQFQDKNFHTVYYRQSK